LIRSERYLLAFIKPDALLFANGKAQPVKKLLRVGNARDLKERDRTYPRFLEALRPYG
jgi:hypothetical protein